MVKKIWDNKDSGLPLIVLDTPWQSIQEFSDSQSCTGVFLFTDNKYRVKYVGHTWENCIHEAIRDAIEDDKNKNCKLVKILYTSEDYDAKLIANVLTEKYAPENNATANKITNSNKRDRDVN